MKRLFLVLLLMVFSVSLLAEARGGFSSGGRGSFSSSRSFSSPSRSSSSFSSSKSYSAPSRSTFSTPSRTSSVTTTTTSRRYVGGGYGYGGHMYGGMGMGYGYSNGLITGMILGNMMHPQGTVVYTGSGSYSNNALLYPDGRVVNQQGYQVGTYVDGQFTAVDGGMVAQPAPQASPAPQPVVIERNDGDDVLNFIGVIGIVLLIVIFFVVLI